MPRALDADEIVDLRIRGESVTAIARRFGCAISDVLDAIDCFARATLTNRLRTHSLALDLARLDKMLKKFDAQAQGGDPHSAMIVLKIIERRQIMLGLAAPPRVDPQLIEFQIKPAVSSTERIREALDRLRELPAPEPSGDDG